LVNTGDFSDFLELVPDAMMVVDAGSVMTLVNAATEQHFGIPRASLLGQRLELLVPGVALALDAAWDGEVVARRGNGEEFPASMVIRPLELGGTPLAALTLRDLSPQRRTERAMARLQDLSRIGTWSLDLRDNTGTYSQEFKSLLGLTGSLTRAALMERINPQDLARLLEHRVHLERDTTPLHVQYRARHEDGTWRYLEGTVYMEQDSRGVPMRLHGLSMDVTARVLAQQAEHQALQQLAAADRLAALGLVSANLAHEINNPLGVITANLTLASECAATLAPLDAGSEAAVEMLQEIRDAREAAERIRQIVKDLRAFSSNNQPPQSINVKTAVEAALRMGRYEIQHRAQVVTQVDPDLAVLATEARLGQILTNLLVNAAQAIPEGAAHKHRIQVRALQAGAQVLVEITDTGPGITPEVLDRLFTPFFTTKPHGTGLGLSITRRIAQDLHGDIEVESTPGAGTTFRVRLPAASQVPPAATPSKAARTSARVLVVDDDAAVGAAIQRSFRGRHETKVVTSAAAALALIERGQEFDVILCDVTMPNMNGPQFLAALEKTRPDLASRLALMTGGLSNHPSQQGLRDGMRNPLVDKPFELSTLLALVDKLAGL